MNKKLIVLIVALECVFAVFLVSIFGPMIESLHSQVIVTDLYFVDDSGERMEDGQTVTVNLSQSLSYDFKFAVETVDATDRTVDIIHNRADNEIEIIKTGEHSFTVNFLSMDVQSVTIIVRARDSSQKTASITLSRGGSNVDIDDFK